MRNVQPSACRARQTRLSLLIHFTASKETATAWVSAGQRGDRRGIFAPNVAVAVMYYITRHCFSQGRQSTLQLTFCASYTQGRGFELKSRGMMQ